VSDNVKIDLDDNSKYRVTLELATRIFGEELTKPETKESFKADPRSYWLNLYAQCRRVVLDGYPPKDGKRSTDPKDYD
jgi:hypothetical protein